MQSITVLTEKIYDIARDTSVNKDEAIGEIERRISYHLDDVLKVIKNINETSFNESDKFKRFIELEEKFGIPKTHLIIK
jgi:hypothetical protein